MFNFLYVNVRKCFRIIKVLFLTNVTDVAFLNYWTKPELLSRNMYKASKQKNMADAPVDFGSKLSFVV